MCLVQAGSTPVTGAEEVAVAVAEAAAEEEAEAAAAAEMIAMMQQRTDED